NLSTGLHDVRIDFEQGTGGDQAQVSYTPQGGTPQPIPFSVLYTPDPLNLGSNITVSASSTIQLTGSAFTAVGLGALTQSAGSNLTVAGQSGKRLTFTGTTLTGGGAITVTDTPDVVLGPVTSSSGT